MKASICPSGTGGNWVLPLSGTMNNNVSGSFYNLLIKYNAASGAEGASNIISLPLAFVRSGDVHLNGGKAYDVGRNLYGWSRVTVSASSAYTLGVNPTEVYPSNYNYRWRAFPLRCLYLGSV